MQYNLICYNALAQITHNNLILNNTRKGAVQIHNVNAVHEVLPFVNSKILTVQLESLSLVAKFQTKLTPLTSPSKLEKGVGGRDFNLVKYPVGLYNTRLKHYKTKHVDMIQLETMNHPAKPIATSPVKLSQFLVIFQNQF